MKKRLASPPKVFSAQATFKQSSDTSSRQGDLEGPPRTLLRSRSLLSEDTPRFSSSLGGDCSFGRPIFRLVIERDVKLGGLSLKLKAVS